MNITEFANFYKDRGYPHNPDLMKRVVVTDVSTSTLVWKQDQFLVEMYMMHPRAVVVRHAHPFENLVIFLSGSITGNRQGSQLLRELTDKDCGLIGFPLPKNYWHEFTVGQDGAVLYNVTCWDDPAEMDSATVKYIGTPLGPIHQKFLADLTSDK